MPVSVPPTGTLHTSSDLSASFRVSQTWGFSSFWGGGGEAPQALGGWGETWSWASPAVAEASVFSLDLFLIDMMKVMGMQCGCCLLSAAAVPVCFYVTLLGSA